jgi:hypothetical protein
MTQSALNPERAQSILAAWKAGLLSSSDVVAWADQKITDTEETAALPSWLLDLALHGPEKCWLLPEAEFVARTHLDFPILFACRVARLDMGDTRKVEEFARWIARSSLGEDHTMPEVMLGYQVDHLWRDCDRMDLAVDLLRAELPVFASKSREIAATILDLSS